MSLNKYLVHSEQERSRKEGNGMAYLVLFVYLFLGFFLNFFLIEKDPIAAKTQLF